MNDEKVVYYDVKQRNLLAIQFFSALMVSNVLPPAFFSVLVYIPFSLMYPCPIYVCN